jgi:hypothetical protein
MRIATRLLVCCTLLLVASCGERIETEPGPADMQPELTPGGGDLPPMGGDPGAAPEAVEIEVTLSEWNVELSVDSVRAGPVTFNIHNAGNEQHGLRIVRGTDEWATDPYAAGERVSMSIVLSPGVYDVHCPVGAGGASHAARGMQTQLRVH